MTKQIIDNLILEEKKYIANVKDDPDTSESDKESIIQTHEGIIKEYEEERKTAPDESTLKYVPKDSSYVDVEQETVSGTAKIKELNVSSKDQKKNLIYAHHLTRIVLVQLPVMRMLKTIITMVY